MVCSLCGRPLQAGTRFCGSCGRGVQPASFDLQDYLQDAIQVSFKEAVLLDKISGAEILKSPIFRFLALVAIVPLGIQLLRSNKAILYGLALWSMFLWALLLYRLFADRDLSFRLAFGTVLFTCFIGLPLLEIWIGLPPDITGWLVTRNFLAFQLSGYIFGVGIREELAKALPLLGLALFSAKMKRPINGLVLGMMSGIGFAGAENVYYVFKTLGMALDAMKETGQAGYLVIPVYNNVVRMAMTPFLHGCFSAIFGYFISLGAADARRRPFFLLMGLALSATLHGLYDTFVGLSPLWGVALQVFTFFLVMTYILKARGLRSARELGGGVFSRTVMMKAPAISALPAAPAVAPPRAPPAPPPLPSAPDPTVSAEAEQPATISLAGGSVEPASGTVSWRLRGVAGPLAGRTYPLNGETKLGRDATRCAVHLEEQTVSREHATLVPDPAQAAWRLKRLSRGAPVYLNGQPVDDAVLSPGDQIQVGTSVFALEVA